MQALSQLSYSPTEARTVRKGPPTVKKRATATALPADHMGQFKRATVSLEKSLSRPSEVNAVMAT